MIPKAWNVSALVFAIVLCSASALHAHDTSPVTQPAFISGGVGDEDREEMEAVQNNYNLKLVFAGVGGVYLDDVHVVITDAAKNTVLTTDTEGPLLLAQLKPGKYTVTADTQGLSQKETVTVRKRGQTYITIRFPIED